MEIAGTAAAKQRLTFPTVTMTDGIGFACFRSLDEKTMVQDIENVNNVAINKLAGGQIVITAGSGQ